MITQRSSIDLRNKEPMAWKERPLTWSFDHRRHIIRCAYSVDRDPIFQDLFRKLNQWARAKSKYPGLNLSWLYRSVHVAIHEESRMHAFNL